MTFRSETAVLVDYVGSAVAFGMANERIVATIGLLPHVIEGVDRIMDLDEDLGPEMTVVVKALREALDALVSAHAVVAARYENATARLQESINSKGDGDAS